MSDIPQDLRYTREHEWAKKEGDLVRVGVTHFAQDQLGDVVFVELPKVGAKLTALKTFGVVESVKAVSDLFAPLSGEVADVNVELPKHPELVNSDPYGQGWMIVIRPSNAAELDDLLSADAYRELVQGGGGH
jgi:glycine cleavage system H protein